MNEWDVIKSERSVYQRMEIEMNLGLVKKEGYGARRVTCHVIEIEQLG